MERVGQRDWHAGLSRPSGSCPTARDMLRLLRSALCVRVAIRDGRPGFSSRARSSARLSRRRREQARIQRGRQPLAALRRNLDRWRRAFLCSRSGNDGGALPAARPRFGAPEPDPAGRRPASERPLRKGNGPVWGEPTPGRGRARFREFPPLPSASRGGFKCGVEKIQLSNPSGRGQAAPAVA